MIKRGFLRSSRASVALAVLWAFSVLLLVLTTFVLLNRAGKLLANWPGTVLTNIELDKGFAYVANTGLPELSSERYPSPARVLENGVPLPGKANDLFPHIRQAGLGRYSFWQDKVYFSTPDNSDPRTNGRSYTIAYPVIADLTQARGLYGLTAAVFLFTCLLSLLIANERNQFVSRLGRRGVQVLVPLGILLILAINLTRSPSLYILNLALLGIAGMVWSVAILLALFLVNQSTAVFSRLAPQSGAVFVLLGVLSVVSISLTKVIPDLDFSRRILWGIILVVNLWIAWALRTKFKQAVPWKYLTPFFLAVVFSYYVFVAVLPQELQGCHGGGEYSSWNGYCTSPDSGSYYFGWQPGSSRQPLYPVFIHLFSGPDFDATAYAAPYYEEYYAGKPSTLGDVKTDLDPLFRVVRTQILFLLGASLVTCAVMMVTLNSHLPALLFVFLYDQRFFTTYELNQILTEPFVQAWLFLLVAVFLLFIWRGKKILFPIAGALCAALYLTRQASGYTVIFLGAMILWGLVTNWRAYWKPALAGLLVFAALAAVPDVYTYIKTGKAAQESLTYQYRIVFALRVAQKEDIPYMPDEESRNWLRESIRRRDDKDEAYAEQCGSDSYCKNIMQVQSTYEVAMTDRTEAHEPSFYIDVSNAIFRRRWLDYLSFGTDVWVTAMSYPGVERIGVRGSEGNVIISPWSIYGIAFAFAVVLRGKTGFSSATLILAHWGHVMICSLFSIPGQRWMWASDGLVIIALFLLGFEIFRRVLERVPSSKAKRTSPQKVRATAG